MTAAFVTTLTSSLSPDDGQPIDPRRDVVAWDDLRHGRERVASEVLGAAANLFRNDIGLFIRTVSDRRRTSVATLTAFLHEEWSDEIGDAWIAAAGTRPMRALGVQAWLRHIAETARSRDQSLTRLRLLQAALSAHAASDAMSLWCQGLSIAARLEPRRRNDESEFVCSLYEVVADVIATGSIPSDDEIELYERNNSCFPAVLPYAAVNAAGRGNEALASEAEASFHRRITRSITADGYLPLLESTCGALYLESCSLAILSTTEIAWWVPIVHGALGDDRPWVVEPSDDRVCKAAWLLAAACIACIGCTAIRAKCARIFCS